MPKALFNTDVDGFIQKHIVRGNVTTKQQFLEVRQLGREVEAEVFEQLLLFNRIAFKVYGENRVVPFLISRMGTNGLEALVDQDALRFVLWTPTVMHMVTEAQGIDPLVFGHQSTPSHSDPAESLEVGLGAMDKRHALDRKMRRHLVKKLLPLCSMPRNTLAAEAVRMTNLAFTSGKLRAMGFKTNAVDLHSLTLRERGELNTFAADLLEYKHVLESGMTSYTNRKLYDAFQHSASNLETAHSIPQSFRTIATIEHLPDLRALFYATDAPFEELLRLRGKRSSVRFRAWLETTVTGEGAAELTREYMDAVANSKGFFDTTSGKITKAIFMGGVVGSLVGAGVSGAEEALKLAGGGAAIMAAAKLLHPVADTALDSLDELLLADLLKGWSPRMFIQELRKLPRALPPDPWDK